MRFLVALFFAAVGSPLLVAQVTAAGPDSARTYENEAAVFEHLDTTYRMRSDGSGDIVKHVVVRVQSEGAARQFGVLTLAFASASDAAGIENVRVRKHDGTVVTTPSTDSIETSAEVTREAPLYSDLKEVHLPVRSLAAGDTLEYDDHTTLKHADAPGQFWGAERLFYPGTVIVSETVTLQYPSTKYVQVWSPQHKPTVTDHDGLRSYVWTYAELTPTPKKLEDGAAAKDEPKDPDEDSEGRKLPSVAWTTFHSWAELGDWYRSLAKGRAEPTDPLRARAEELTKDAKSPEEQMRALYTYVSTQTRYVGIDLGIGRFQPHLAAEVLANRYGDCKDKDTLLEALLRAKGFTVAPALIGVGIAPVPDLPSPAMFNHVITTVQLPTGRIWLDSTPEVAPFRLLVPPIRDEQALVIPGTGESKLEKTPKAPPFPYEEIFVAKATLDDSGLIKAHVSFQVRSDNELGFRTLLQRVAPAQWDGAMQYVSNGMGFTGVVRNADLHQSDPAGPVHIAYEYDRKSFGDWENLKILPLFPVLEFPRIEADKQPEHDIDLGAPRTLKATTEIQLPSGLLPNLPDPVHVKRDFAEYEQTYRLVGSTMEIERTVVILQQKLPKERWKDYTAFSKSIGLESGETWIQLSRAKSLAPSSSAGAVGGISSGFLDPAKTEATPQELMRTAEAQERAADWSAEGKTLDQIRARAPKTPYLFSMLGFRASRLNQHAEALTDYETELRNHPEDRPWIAVLLGWEYENAKRGDEAVKLLKTYADRGDRDIAVNLANLQYRHEDYAGAAETLQAGLKAFPKDRPMLLQLAPALHMAKRDVEAADAVREALDGEVDPFTLNQGAYLLSAVLRVDLPFAERSARQAVDLLETATTERTLPETNDTAYGQSSLLLAAWDTLGWILVLEHQDGTAPAAIARAEQLLTASWLGNLHAEVGDHLGYLYETTDRKGIALRQYRLAHAAMDKNTGPPIRDHVEGAIHRLVQFEDGSETPPEVRERFRAVAGEVSRAGTKVEKHASLRGAPEDKRSADTSALLALRTYKVPRPPGLTGWGTFRFQITSTGVFDVQQASGEPKLKAMAGSLQALPFARMVPADAKARLLRSGVLSCSSDPCELVLVPNGSMSTERQ